MKKNITVLSVLSTENPHTVQLPATYQTDGSDEVIKDILSRVEGALSSNVEAVIEGVKYTDVNGVLTDAKIKVSDPNTEDIGALNYWLFHVGMEWVKDFDGWEQTFKFQKEF